MDLQGLLTTSRLYENITDITLAPFKALMTIQMTRYYFDELLCFGMFYAIDDLFFEITMKQKFLEGYKDILITPWTLYNYDSMYAKYFDHLELSDNETISVWKREYQELESSVTIFGAIDKENPKLCSNDPFKWLNYESGYKPLNQWY